MGETISAMKRSKLYYTLSFARKVRLIDFTKEDQLTKMIKVRERKLGKPYFSSFSQANLSTALLERLEILDHKEKLNNSKYRRNPV